MFGEKSAVPKRSVKKIDRSQIVGQENLTVPYVYKRWHRWRSVNDFDNDI